MTLARQTRATTARTPRRAPADLPFGFADRGLAQALAAERDEPAWLRQERLAAFAAFESLPVESNQLYTPYIDIQEDDTTMTHEATVGKISAEQVFYLMSRGLTENEAQNLIVHGFLEVFTKELPMEYAIEFNRLVKLEMEGSLG